MNKAYPILLAGAALGLAIYSMQTDKPGSANLAQGQAQLDAQASHYPNHNPGVNTANTPQRTNAIEQPGAAMASPFGMGGTMQAGVNSAPGTNTLANGPTPDKEVISEAEAARRKKMTQLGYDIPPDYYTKNISTLKQLARKGDAYALVHLGEKYYFELNGQKDNPEYDPKADYPALAKQSFTQALAAGNVRSAGIISELYLQENNVVDAYAWHLVSKRLDDNISAEWFQKTAAYNSLTELQKQQGSSRVPGLIANINEISSKIKSKTLF